MEFRTIIELQKSATAISHNNNCVFLGSCFAENIGNRLCETKITTSVNPTGILYNPLSIRKSVCNALRGHKYSENEIFHSNGLWNCYDFHSKFSNLDKNHCLEKINSANKNLQNALTNADILFVTFGTSFVYELAQTGEIVCNCHKQPEKIFTRRMLSVQEIVESWTKCIAEIKTINPEIKIVFTVSPIRHWRDGAHQNQISKSILHIAISELNAKFSETDYFPAYEIVMDDLRDYRFYASDMIHPSEQAVDYIWERFCEKYFSVETMTVISKIQKILTASKHRPFNPKSLEYKNFCAKNLAEINELKQKFQNINFDDEEKFFASKLADWSS